MCEEIDTQAAADTYYFFLCLFMQYCLYCNNKQKPTLGSKNCFAGVCAIHIHNLFELAVGVE